MIMDGTSSLTSLGTIFTQLMSWVTSLLTTITASGNEILLLRVGVFAVGAIIGLCKRLIN